MHKKTILLTIIMLIAVAQVAFAVQNKYQEQHGEELDNVPFEVKQAFYRDNGVDWEDSYYETRIEFLDDWYKDEKVRARKEKAENRQLKREKKAWDAAENAERERIQRRERDEEREYSIAQKEEKLKEKKEKIRKKRFTKKVKSEKDKIKDYRKKARKDKNK